MLGESLDISIFPLLRIDQLRLHDASTLMKAEKALQTLAIPQTDGDNPLANYCCRLFDMIQSELAIRRIDNLIEKTSDGTNCSLMCGRTSGNGIWRTSASTDVALSNAKSLLINDFIRSPKNSDGKIEFHEKPSRVSEKDYRTNPSSAAYVVAAALGCLGGLRRRAQFMGRMKKVTNADNCKRHNDSDVRKRRPTRQRRKLRITQASKKNAIIKSQHIRGTKCCEIEANTDIEREIEANTDIERCNECVAKSIHEENTDDNPNKSGRVHQSCTDKSDNSILSQLEANVSSLSTDLIEEMESTQDRERSCERKLGLSTTTEISPAPNNFEGRINSTSLEQNCGDIRAPEFIVITPTLKGHQKDMVKRTSLSPPVDTPDSFAIGNLDKNESSTEPRNGVPDSALDDRIAPLQQSKKLTVMPCNCSLQIEKQIFNVKLSMTEVIAAGISDNSEENLRQEKKSSKVDMITASDELSSFTEQDTLSIDHFKSDSFCQTFPTFESIFNMYAGKESHIYISKSEAEALLRQVMLCQVNSVSTTIEGVNRRRDSGMNKIANSRFYRVLSNRIEVVSLVSEALDDYARVGLWMERAHCFPKELDNSLNLLWTWSSPKFKLDHVLVCQKVSRFKGTKTLIRKDLLKKKLSHPILSPSLLPDNQEWKGSRTSIMPPTFTLPSEYTLFVATFSKLKKCCDVMNSTWIIKPVGMSRGRGIFLINDIGDVCYSKPIVAQKYIGNPLLFRGFKFDLRLYILVTSFNPLEAFIHQEGFARFSTQPFSTCLDTIGDLRIHLTNSSVQKNFLSDMIPSHPVRLAGRDGGGSKVKLSWLMGKLKHDGVDVSLLWNRICDCCIKVLSCVDRDISFQPSSFEIFGFDVLIDDQMKPWVIEVNASPSMARENELDADVKENLIKDTVVLVDPPAINWAALLDICDQRLKLVTGHAGNFGDYHCKNRLESDLRRIFFNGLPRKYGECPVDMGGFQYLAPLR